MKILFITMVWPSQNTHNMYSELMSEFVDRGHSVDVLALTEKRNKIDTHLSVDKELRVAYIKCGNIQKTNKYAKVINSFLGGIKMVYVANIFFKNERYNTMIFALPPLTIAPFVIYLKKQYETQLYLLLKEFWPQDPVDLGAMKYGGIVWRVFRYLEKLLYSNSDYIGTMSKKGIEYIKKQNLDYNKIIEVCPNSQKDLQLDNIDRYQLREQYNLPHDKCIFIFGGNFGVSQGINEMIECISSILDIEEVFVLLVGNGSEYQRVKDSFQSAPNDKIAIKDYVPRKDFDNIVRACDIGMIFLYPQYTVPNIPSRFVSYLFAGLPVLAAIDNSTDLGTIIENNKCGISVKNGDTVSFRNAVIKLLDKNVRHEMSKNSNELFVNEYTTEKCFKIIQKHFTDIG